MNFIAIKMRKGFTLIELLIVISIIAILAAVIGINALESGKKSRDAKRQADIRTLQTAVELYRQKYGRYPEGCRGADQWSGQQGSGYDCAGNDTQYIVGSVDTADLDADGDTTERLSFAPQFIPVLPFEKKLNGLNSGYAYMTNAAGTVYKIMAMNTVEADSGLIPANSNDFRPYLHPLKSCDMRARLNSDNSTSFLAAESWCNTTARNIGFGTNAAVPHCRHTDSRFQRSYSVWGGLAPCTGNCSIATGAGANTVEAWTELIICQ